MLHNPDPKVNMINPKVKSLTLPKISARRPKFNRREAITREYPIIIHTIVNTEVPSSDAIVGNAIKIIFASRDCNKCAKRSVP